MANIPININRLAEDPGPGMGAGKGQDLNDGQVRAEKTSKGSFPSCLHSLQQGKSDQLGTSKSDEVINKLNQGTLKEETKEDSDLNTKETFLDLLNNLQQILMAVSGSGENDVPIEGLNLQSGTKESLTKLLGDLQDLLSVGEIDQTAIKDLKGIELLLNGLDNKNNPVLNKLSLGSKAAESDHEKMLQETFSMLKASDDKVRLSHQIVDQINDVLTRLKKNNLNLSEGQQGSLKSIKEILTNLVNQKDIQLSGDTQSNPKNLFQVLTKDGSKDSLIQNNEQISWPGKEKLQDIISSLRTTFEEIGHNRGDKASTQDTLFHGLEGKDIAFFMNQGKKSQNGGSKVSDRNAHLMNNTLEDQLQKLISHKSVDHKGNSSKQLQAAIHGLNVNNQQQGNTQNNTLPGFGQSAGHNPASVNEGVQTNGSSAQNLLLTTEKGVVEQVFLRLNNAYRDGNRNVLLQLHPPELGKLRIRLTSEKGKIRAHLQSQNEQVHDLLQKHLPRLRESLEEQGIQVEEMMVDVNSNSSDGSYDRYAGEKDKHKPIIDSKKGELGQPEIMALENSLESAQTPGALSLRI